MSDQPVKQSKPTSSAQTGEKRSERDIQESNTQPMNAPAGELLKNADKQSKPSNSVFLELVFNIFVPSFILMKLSGEDYLGSVDALIVALSFPITYGIYDFIRARSVNFIALLGFLSTLLTGAIGLYELDAHWLAVKEAAIPAVIGVVVLLSGFTHKPLVARLVLNQTLFNLTLIYDQLAQRGTTERFKQKILRANHYLASTFAFSSAANYLLAKYIVTSPAGTVAFNEELGKMTMLSYPVIAIPSFAMLIGLLIYTVKAVMSLTGLSFEQMLNQE